MLVNLNGDIGAMEDRIEALYEEADPKGIVVSTPGIGVTLSAGILGRLGDPNRFANLAGVRSFTRTVPKIDQSGLANRNKGLTKAGNHGLREALFLAADMARKIDPTLAERYHRLVVEGRPHTSAVCTLAAVMATRIAACWRRGELYVLRDVNGTEITEAEGPSALHRPLQGHRRTPGCPEAGQHSPTAEEAGGGQGSKESTKAAPASDPAGEDDIPSNPRSMTQYRARCAHDSQRSARLPRAISETIVTCAEKTGYGCEGSPRLGDEHVDERASYEVDDARRYVSGSSVSNDAYADKRLSSRRVGMGLACKRSYAC